MTNKHCEFCEGTGIVKTLNIWQIRDDHILGTLPLAAYDSAATLPFISGPCPNCYPDEYRKMIDDLYAKHGKVFDDC